MLTPEQLKELYSKLAAPLPEDAIEKSLARETKKGYDTTGYGYQYCVNRMNEVLGPAYWRAIAEVVGNNTGTSSGKTYYDIAMKMTVQIGNPKIYMEEAAGPVQVFEVLAEQTCYGGHKSYGSLADALKGAYTNALKKTLALFGVGKQAYEGSIDDDNKPQGDHQKNGPQGGQRQNNRPSGQSQGQQRQQVQQGQRPPQGNVYNYPPRGQNQPPQRQPNQGNQQPPQGQRPNQGGTPQGHPNQGGQRSNQGGQQPNQGGQRPPQGQANQGQSPQGQPGQGQGQAPSRGKQIKRSFIPFKNTAFIVSKPAVTTNGPNGQTIATLIATDSNGQICELRPHPDTKEQAEIIAGLKQGQQIIVTGLRDANAVVVQQAQIC